ncbi:transposase [uncultured Thiodictyon sp.]|uniref:transposase n=1 Tax=uncultured Thiodictyon sp. TaxID=1846217 RepID=UPI0025DD7CCD|nr:transposase [uncultured Thiodictyon sp.]
MELLGFSNAGGTLRCGQPAFAPRALLKLYIAGDVDRVHSSRRLARECRRNLELIWLLESLTPSYRTIAEFRKINGVALQAACKDFICPAAAWRPPGRDGLRRRPLPAATIRPAQAGEHRYPGERGGALRAQT